MNPKTKHVGVIVLKIFGVLIPAITSYIVAKMEVVAANAHAEAGYIVSVKALENLASEVDECKVQTAELRGKVSLLQAFGMVPKLASIEPEITIDQSDEIEVDEVEGAGDGDSVPRVKPTSSEGKVDFPVGKASKISRKPLPRSLNSAYQMQQQQAAAF